MILFYINLILALVNFLIAFSHYPKVNIRSLNVGLFNLSGALFSLIMI